MILGATWHCHGSAEWHSAVSRIGTPRALDRFKRIVNDCALRMKFGDTAG